jgi:hypothetical protein
MTGHWVRQNGRYGKVLVRWPTLALMAVETPTGEIEHWDTWAGDIYVTDPPPDSKEETCPTSLS